MICTKCYVVSSYTTNDVRVVGFALLGYQKTVQNELQSNSMIIGLQYARIRYSQQHLHRKCIKRSHNMPQTSSHCDKVDYKHYQILNIEFILQIRISYTCRSIIMLQQYNMYSIQTCIKIEVPSFSCIKIEQISSLQV